AGERLFCAADGEALVALHRDTGAVLGSVTLPGKPDVVMHDPALARLYVASDRQGSSASSTITVLRPCRQFLPNLVPTPLPGIRTRAHCTLFYLEVAARQYLSSSK